jgi:transcriptional regulator with XRE-family HTH domain
MNDRLDKLLLAEQLTPAKFADLIGVQRSSISHIISGRNKPSFDFIAKVLSKFPRVNSEWLILGKGEMYKQMVQASLFDSPVLNPTVLGEDASNEEIKRQEEVSISENRTPNSFLSNNHSANESVMSSNGQRIESLFGKDVERIVVFYNDRTFRSYTPSED